MTGHLLLITFGPVQDFIAQARRTRDLWFGSHLLSELGRAAVRVLVDGGAQLVFPALARGDPELVASAAPLRRNGRPPLNIANKLLAEVPASVDAGALARAARDEVMRFWRQEIAGSVRNHCRALLADGIEEAWDEQIDTFLEFNASWAPVGDYLAAREAVERAVAARKNLRDFKQWTHLRGDVRKSSLDGARETVLKPAIQRDIALVRRYRIAGGEELDAVGLVKRTGGEPDQFVPVVNVALASWVDAAAREAPGRLDTLKKRCRDLGLARIARDDLPCARAFPFDASVLLRSRWKSVFDEQGLPGEPEHWGRQHVGPLLDVLSDPYPYVACLAADGDLIGQAIDQLRSAEEHRRFSRAMSGFAAGARKIVEHDHRGSLIYAGGDDVLAFLPLPEVLSCADALRRRFGEVVAATGAIPAQRTTLSVGIGVGHVMESMGDLLSLGRAAEQYAKRGNGADPERNAVAVILEKRSGARRSWRARWDDGDGQPIVRLRADGEALAEQLSSRKVYEVARTLRRLPDPACLSQSAWAHLAVLEVRRALSRVHGGAAGVEPAAIGLRLDERIGYAALHAEISTWVERMLVAHTFAAAAPKPRRRIEEDAAL